MSTRITRSASKAVVKRAPDIFLCCVLFSKNIFPWAPIHSFESFSQSSVSSFCFLSFFQRRRRKSSSTWMPSVRIGGALVFPSFFLFPLFSSLFFFEKREISVHFSSLIEIGTQLENFSPKNRREGDCSYCCSCGERKGQEFSDNGRE